MRSIATFLWFNEGAEEALALYSRVFPDSSVLSVDRRHVEGHETFMSANLRIGSATLVLFNGGPYGDFRFNTAASIYVICDDQEEVDHYWDGLSAQGEAGRCGWLSDPFGVSWQIVPKLFHELMSDPDPARTERVFQAMMTMSRLDCAQLQAAYDGDDSRGFGPVH